MSVGVKACHKHVLGTRSTRSTLFGITLRTVGCLVMALSTVAITSIPLLYSGGPTAWVFAYISGLFLASSSFVWGSRLSVIGRRHFSRVLHAPEQLHDESFVLYLRSFEDDSAMAKPEIKFRDIMTPLNAHALFNSGLTAEEQIVQALAPAGPVVAVGRPGERLPHVGALRMYPAEDSWQRVVLDLMEHARLVVLGVGQGRSLMWEFFQAVQRIHPHRLIILAPQGRGQYEDFRESAGAYVDSMIRNGHGMVRVGTEYTSINLPDFPSAEKWAYLDAVHSWLIRFDSDWAAERIILSSSGLDRNRIRKALREGMNPVFQRIFEAKA